MITRDIFNLLHAGIEAKNFGKRITHKQMAKNLGISMRTYQEWRLGNTSPMAAKAIFKMLGELEDDEAIRIIKKINHKREVNG